MKQFIEQLEMENVGIILEKEPLTNHTTWKIGGPADVLIQPRDKQSLTKTMQLIHQYQLPWQAIGRGSNLLVRDKGIRGVVIKLSDGLNQLHFENNIVNVGVGYSLIRLAIMAGKRGLTGLEFAGGIPGTVGGGIYMNAGAHGSDISRVLKSADILLENGELIQYLAADMKFHYRYSVLQELKGIIVGATFQLAHGDQKRITEAMTKHKNNRRLSQPIQLPCAGSVFRNPLPDHAGRLIEAAGLKGFQLGGAQISEKHANFIVNRGGASAQDVLDLIGHVQSVIAKKYNAELLPEVEVIGER